MSPYQALVVDDNIKNLSVLTQLLTQEGVSTIQVSHPHQLDTLIETEDKFDIVFLDIEMPGLNGYDVLQKLKADQRFTGVPIVAYTVHISEINRAFQLGFHSFISKPIDPDKFPAQLAAILQGEPIWNR